MLWRMVLEVNAGGQSGSPNCSSAPIENLETSAVLLGLHCSSVFVNWIWRALLQSTNLPLTSRSEKLLHAPTYRWKEDESLPAAADVLNLQCDS